MPRAVIQGETHLSKKDKKALLELDLSQFDAVFREGGDTDHFNRDISLLYALFAIGHVVYGATYGRLYISFDEVGEELQRSGVPLYDEIDAAVHETYDMVPRWKRILLLVLSPVLAVIILGFASAPLQAIVPRLSPATSSLLGMIAALALIFGFGFTWALAYFLLIENEAMYDRDQVMASGRHRKVHTPRRCLAVDVRVNSVFK